MKFFSKLKNLGTIIKETNQAYKKETDIFGPNFVQKNPNYNSNISNTDSVNTNLVRLITSIQNPDKIVKICRDSNRETKEAIIDYYERVMEDPNKESEHIKAGSIINRLTNYPNN